MQTASLISYNTVTPGFQIVFRRASRWTRSDSDSARRQKQAPSPIGFRRVLCVLPYVNDLVR